MIVERDGGDDGVGPLFIILILAALVMGVAVVWYLMVRRKKGKKGN